MTLAYLLLLTGLTISAVAIYYSVIGLAAVFAAAAIPVYIMGTTLEVAKLVCASWLKANWGRIPALMKLYMTTAVIVLMLITSMGIFGFLSKAHLDQNIVSGDVQSKIALVDEKIKIERENIANAQQVIKQMDAAVNGVLATGDQAVKLRDGSTRVNSAAERSLQIRRTQAKDRDALTKQIEQSQTQIIKLQEEVAPIRAEMRQVEAKVGPIKYIAALIYGDNPDANILEKAVTWVIIIIVVVFDPLAIIMLLAAQMTFSWRREEKENEGLLHKTVPLFVPPLPEEEKKPTYEPDDGALTQEQLDQINQLASEASVKPEPIVPEPTIKFVDNGEHPKDNFEHELEVKEESKEEVTRIEPTISLDSINELERWNKMIEEAERADFHEKEAMRKWKIDHPEDTIKNQEKKKELGLIQILPWELEQQRQAQIEKETAAKYKIFPSLQTELNKLEPDFPKQERIKPDLTEVVESEDQKKNELRDKASGSTDNKDPSVTYVQNSEQSSDSLWNRINKENK
jgi:hypothetical protein